MKIRKLKIKNCKSGYAILELLFYISFFAVFALLVINAMIIMTRSLKEAAIQGELVQSGVIMERIGREIRQAHDINAISAADLELATTDSVGTAKTVEFLLSSSNVQFLENDVLTGNLNTSKIVVTALTFTQITTAEGKAVKVALTVRSTNDTLNRTFDFYDTVGLRGSY